MEIGEALQKCLVMGKAVTNENRSPEIDATLWLNIDPATEAGAAVIEWWNNTGPFSPIEVSDKPAREYTWEETLQMLAPKNP